MSRFCSDFSVSIFVLSRPRAAVKRDPPLLLETADIGQTLVVTGLQAA